MTARAGATSSTGTIQHGPRQLVFNDTLTPVVAPGLAHGVAQAVDSPSTRTFLVSGSTMASNGVGQLGTDQMATYTPGPFQKVGIALHIPSVGLFWCPTQNGLTPADLDVRYGLPGCSVWTHRLVYNSTGTKLRISQRWYSLPTVRDVLYFEVDVSMDPTATVAFPTQNLNLSVMTETVTGHIETAAYDATLDGISMIGQGNSANAAASYTFLRALSHPTVGHSYESGLATDYNFVNGTLGANVDTWNTTAAQTYRGHIAVQDAARSRDRSTVTFRFAMSLGISQAQAANSIRNIPNATFMDAVRANEREVASYPQLQSTNGQERLAWQYHVHTLVTNLREPQSFWNETYGNDGVQRRLPWSAVGRWQGLWTQDSAVGLLGSEALAPDVVHDVLDIYFNKMMDNTGFLRGMPGITNLVQHGSFMFARIARRHLANTGDTAFITGIYAKLKLMWTWWTTTAGYTHPAFPTVYLLTATQAVEIQEVSPITRNGNFPSGEDWATSMAYDFSTHMASLAASTGNSADVAGWNTAATNLRSALQTYCWDAGQGWFQPTMTPSSPNGGQADSLGRFNQVKTYRAFWDLYAGIPTPAQAQIMRDKIMDSTYFLGTYGVRTADKHWVGYDPTDWVQGGSRPYHDAAVINGLRRYGFTADADTLLAKWMTNQLAKGTTPEMINPDVGGGGFARFLFAGNMLMEAYLFKNDPAKLFGVGTTAVTS